jgi:anti-anti-sigma factor
MDATILTEERAMEYHFDVERHDGRVTVYLTGEIDMDAKGAVEDALTSGLRGQVSRLDVDLTAVTFLDSSGISSLVTAWRGARERGVAFGLSPSTPEVERVLEITGIREMLDRVV